MIASLLERIFDPMSRRRRAMVVQPGRRCLEVGAGHGSMADWMAEQVGPGGRVVATDIDAGYLRGLERSNLEVRRHDILEDPVEAPGMFDVVCSRRLLFHLTGRQEEAIRRMAHCLRPGGWMIDEDADWGTMTVVDAPHTRYGGFCAAWRDGDLCASRGYDPAFGRKLPALFERCGLQNIRHEASSEVVRGRSPMGAVDPRQPQRQARASGGLTTEQAREQQIISAALDDPSVWFLRELLHACFGQHPRDTTRRGHPRYARIDLVVGALDAHPWPRLALMPKPRGRSAIIICCCRRSRSAGPRRCWRSFRRRNPGYRLPCIRTLRRSCRATSRALLLSQIQANVAEVTQVASQRRCK